MTFLSGVPQGSILGSQLLNIYICDLLSGIEDLDIASYADDNTRFTFASELDMALKKLRTYTIKIPQNPEYMPRAYIRRKVFFGGPILGWVYIWLGLKPEWIFCWNQNKTIFLAPKLLIFRISKLIK